MKKLKSKTLIILIAISIAIIISVALVINKVIELSKKKELIKSEDSKESIVTVNELKINTSKLELEEGTSFKLNVIVLPNDAINKEIKWMSSDESVVMVNDKGLVSAKKEGKAIITAKSADKDKTVFCEVDVKKAEIARIKIDNISKEAKEFASYNVDKIYKEYNEITKDSNGNYKEKYYTILEDGSKKLNDSWQEENDKYIKNLEEAFSIRSNIINKLVDDKKSFIILKHTKKCEEEEYSVSDGAEKILKENNYSYLYIDTLSCNGDESIERSKIYIDEFENAPIIIIKGGEIYKYVDPNSISIKNDEETKNWLNKYINIK